MEIKKVTIKMNMELIKKLEKIAKDRERDLSKQIRFMLKMSIKDNYTNTEPQKERKR